MKALVLHDETGRIASLAVIEDDIDLQMIPDRGEFVLEVDAEELELTGVSALTEENAERIRASLARARGSLRVDTAEHVRRSTKRFIKVPKERGSR